MAKAKKSKAEQVFKAAQKLEVAQVKFAKARDELEVAEDAFETVVEALQFNEVEDTAYGDDDDNYPF